MKELEKARVKLLLNYPFYAYLAIHLEEREDKNLPVPTMGTDGRRLYYVPEYVKGLAPDELVGVLAHEVMHCALLHVGKQRMGTRNAIAMTDHGPVALWNIAADYAVNAILIKDKFTLPKGVLYREDFKEMGAEQIYAKLLEEAQANGTLTELCDDGSPSPQKGGKKGKGQGQMKGGPLDDHSKWGKGGKKDDDGEGQGEGEGQADANGVDDETWRQRVAAAANQAKMQGKLPAHLHSLIENLVHPVLDWRIILRDFLHVTMSKSNYRLFPANKRYIWQGIYLPSTYGERVEVAVAIDTSGSIDDKTLQAFLSEIRGITEAFGDYAIHVMQCDAQVHDYTLVEPYNAELPSKMLGRGGTSFVPPFEYLNEHAIQPPCLVYLTDGYGNFPATPPPYPVMWVITNEQVTAPFGQTIRLSAD